MNNSRMPRGIRNNNPLNMKEFDIPWRGKVGDDGIFTIFETPWYGIRAAANDIKNDYLKGKNTIAALLAEFAPDVENNTGSYIAHISQKVGIGPHEPISSARQLTAMVDTMILHENGQQPYDQELIADAVMAGLTSGKPLPGYFDLTKVVNYGIA